MEFVRLRKGVPLKTGTNELYEETAFNFFKLIVRRYPPGHGAHDQARKLGKDVTRAYMQFHDAHKFDELNQECWKAIGAMVEYLDQQGLKH
ncbi:MAG TPA: hypothetical protein VH370_01365 [Humisphaera sp.]|jgi:hypothetical protein|nr:hypothetical protein [Humisphaera sp.]